MYRYIKSNSSDLESSDQFELSSPQQEYDSAKTSINSKKLPAIYNMVSFTPGDVVLDYGGGKFDNAVEYLADKDVTLLVYDPYNRSAAHNAEVVKVLRQNGGADATVCSNVLNVIKEPEVRTAVLENIKKLTKSGGDIYITVYEGSKTGKDGPTKSGYQLNRKTEGYLDEIREVFPDARRKGKLVYATNMSSVNSSAATNSNDYSSSNSQYISYNHIGDYIQDNYYWEDIDDKYACINSLRESFKGEKYIAKDIIEQFIGAHNGQDKLDSCDKSDILSSYRLGDQISYNGQAYIIIDDQDPEYPDTFRCRPIDKFTPEDFDAPDEGDAFDDVYLIESQIDSSVSTATTSTGIEIDAENLKGKSREEIDQILDDAPIGSQVVHIRNLKNRFNMDEHIEKRSAYQANYYQGMGTPLDFKHLDTFWEIGAYKDPYIDDTIYNVVNGMNKYYGLTSEVLKAHGITSSVHLSDDEHTNLTICPYCYGDRFNDKLGLCLDCGYDEKSWSTDPYYDQEYQDDYDDYDHDYEPTNEDWQEIQNRVDSASSDTIYDRRETIIKNKHKYVLRYTIIDNGPNADPQKMMDDFKFSISRLSPYDDANYAWCSGNQGKIRCYRDDSLIDTSFYMNADDMGVENNEWCDYIIQGAVDLLERLNHSIDPKIIHNSSNYCSRQTVIEASSTAMIKNLNDRLYSKASKYLKDNLDWDLKDISDMLFIDIAKVEDNRYKVQVRAELDYDWMFDLITALDPIVQKYDHDAYFDMLEPGISEAYIYVDNIQSSTSGYVYTYCDNCGYKNRVLVEFPDSNKPFLSTEYECDKCHNMNKLVDNHKYDESGYIINASTDDAVDWYMIDRKTVKDSDGFTTDYTWYADGNTHIFIFGDNDIYTPYNSGPDFETEDYNEAENWFNSYEGEE